MTDVVVNHIEGYDHDTLKTEKDWKDLRDKMEAQEQKRIEMEIYELQNKYSEQERTSRETIRHKMNKEFEE